MQVKVKALHLPEQRIKQALRDLLASILFKAAAHQFEIGSELICRTIGLWRGSWRFCRFNPCARDGKKSSIDLVLAPDVQLRQVLLIIFQRLCQQVGRLRLLLRTAEQIDEVAYRRSVV